MGGYAFIMTLLKSKDVKRMIQRGEGVKKKILKVVMRVIKTRLIKFVGILKV